LGKTTADGVTETAGVVVANEPKSPKSEPTSIAVAGVETIFDTALEGAATGATSSRTRRTHPSQQEQ
jgi:hypothetical protein